MSSCPCLCLTVMILLVSINIFSVTSLTAVKVRSHLKYNGEQSNLILACHRSNKILDDFQRCCDGALLRYSVLTFLASAVIFSPTSSMAYGGQDYLVSQSSAITELSMMSPSNSYAELGLKPATDTQPQITLKGHIQNDLSFQRNTPLKQTRDPILQGLVYFPDFAPNDPTAKLSGRTQGTQQLDYIDDMLVLTAVSSSQPNGPILAGAKIPVSSLRFPFSFQMFKENLLTKNPDVNAAWERAANFDDIIMRASICPFDSSSFPCAEVERKKSAEGVAKLITKLPGLSEGDHIRAPASLALQ